MDGVIVLSTLLLVGLTWLLYRLAVALEPRGEKPQGSQQVDFSGDAPGIGRSTQKLTHESLRK